MTIKIIEEPTVYLSRAEHDRLWREYQKNCMMMVNPPSFEEYVKRHASHVNYAAPLPPNT